MRVELLRWICVLPAAILGGIAADYCGGVAGRFVILCWESVFKADIAFSIQLLMHAALAAAFVLAGTFTAPRSRRVIALVLAISRILLSSFIHVLSQDHPGRTNYLHLTAETIGAVLAVAYVYYAKKFREREKTPAIE